MFSCYLCKAIKLKQIINGVLKVRLKTFSIALTQVHHAVAWPNSGVAESTPSQPFADRYTLIEQSNTLLKQSARTMYNLLIKSSYGSVYYSIA